MQKYMTYETVGHQACERAIRWRLGNLGTGRDAAAHLQARRRSLGLLHLSLQADRLDDIQVRLLEELLDLYERTLVERKLPIWPGAETKQLCETAEEQVAIEIARSQLRHGRCEQSSAAAR
jgi:hypothetical protein